MDYNKFKELIAYNKNMLNNYIQSQDILLEKESSEHQKKSSFYMQKNILSRNINVLEKSQKILENLFNFELLIPQIPYEIDCLLPLMNLKSKKKIKDFFLSSVIEYKNKKNLFFEDAKQQSNEFLPLFPEEYQKIFEQFYQYKYDLFLNCDYFKQLVFNDTTIDPSSLLTQDSMKIINMLEELINSGTLEDNYIKNNFENIKKAFISRDKSIFTNNKLDIILDIDDIDAYFDFQKLKTLLSKIRHNNDIKIEEANKILNNISTDKIELEYSKLKDDSYKNNDDEASEILLSNENSNSSDKTLVYEKTPIEEAKNHISNFSLEQLMEMNLELEEKLLKHKKYLESKKNKK